MISNAFVGVKVRKLPRVLNQLILVRLGQYCLLQILRRSPCVEKASVYLTLLIQLHFKGWLHCTVIKGFQVQRGEEGVLKDFLCIARRTKTFLLVLI